MDGWRTYQCMCDSVYLLSLLWPVGVALTNEFLDGTLQVDGLDY